MKAPSVLLSVLCINIAHVLSEETSWIELEPAKFIEGSRFTKIFTGRIETPKRVVNTPTVRGIETVRSSKIAAPKFLDSDTKVLDLLPQLGLNKFWSYAALTGLEPLLNSSKVSLTLFVPTDEAFTAAGHDWEDNMLNVIQHHILNQALVSPMIKNDIVYETRAAKSGLRTNVYAFGTPKVITASGAVVTSPDHLASNGVVHVVDRLSVQLPVKTLAQMVNASAEHKLLFSLLNISGLVSVLNDSSAALTLVAPTDGAFSKLPKATLDKLHKNSTLLKQVLLRHVISSTYFSAGVVDDLSVTTESKEPLVWLKGAGGVTVFSNNTLSNVQTADLAATNGVLHVVDTVLYDTATAMMELLFHY